MDFNDKNKLPANLTNHEGKSRDDNVPNGWIQVRPPLNVDFVDLTSDGEHESLIPVLDLDESSALMLELVKDLIDLTEPVNESDMQTVDLTEETASVVETSMQSLSRSSPVTVDSAEASLSLNVNVIVDLTEDPSVSVDLLDLMEPIEDQADERIEDEEEEVTDSITINGQESDVELEHLHEQLHLLQRKISDLESAEVDFDDEDDSSFIIIDQYKQEACRIYEKISRITGKSQEFVDEPIQFDGTEFTEFNKKLEQMLNENRSFPNALDVLESLERCNRDHRYQLTEEDRSKVAEKALLQIGRVFQQQRKAKLNETFSFYTSDSSDPALDDDDLQAKLDNNKRMSE